MEGSVQSQSNATESAYRSFIGQNGDGDHLTALRHQMEQLNTIGKRFVAAIDRFQLHRALLATLQELYSFSACSILLKGDPFELSIIPRYPLTGPFIQAMIQSIARAGSVIGFPDVTPEELAVVADLDAPDDLAPSFINTPSTATEIGDFLNIPLTVESRIIGILSLFDEHEGTFDTELLQLTTMIADYAAVALENVRLHEREIALWKDAEQERHHRELIAGVAGDSVPLTLSISAAPLHDASKNIIRPIGVVAVLNDTTSSKQIEKLKDEFVSVVSHELRTPLTAIKGYTQHLIRRIERRLREARQRQQNTGSLAEHPESYDLRSLNIVQSETEHLERLVSDLLDLSRVQWGELDLQYTSFYLTDVLAERVRLAQVSAEQHTIFLDIQAQDSRIVADQLRVGQVIGNILDNAIKFSPPGRQVTVKLQEQDNEYFISVIDQGIGVSPEYLDHIFERFYRVRNIASRQYSGIGMGLFVARAIVEAHGGHIWLSSNRGIGSTFYFTLLRTPRTSTLG